MTNPKQVAENTVKLTEKIVHIIQIFNKQEIISVPSASTDLNLYNRWKKKNLVNGLNHQSAKMRAK